jgi:hypothetical protein
MLIAATPPGDTDRAGCLAELGVAGANLKDPSLGVTLRAPWRAAARGAA